VKEQALSMVSQAADRGTAFNLLTLLEQTPFEGTG